MKWIDVDLMKILGLNLELELDKNSHEIVEIKSGA